MHLAHSKHAVDGGCCSYCNLVILHLPQGILYPFLRNKEWREETWGSFSVVTCAAQTPKTSIMATHHPSFSRIENFQWEPQDSPRRTKKCGHPKRQKQREASSAGRQDTDSSHSSSLLLPKTHTLPPFWPHSFLLFPKLSAFPMPWPHLPGASAWGGFPVTLFLHETWNTKVSFHLPLRPPWLLQI